MVGEHCRDERVQEPAEDFKVEVYFTVLDTLLTQLDERFADFCSTVSHFHCLEPSQLSEDCEDFTVFTSQNFTSQTSQKIV